MSKANITEINATLPEKMKKLSRYFDYVVADIKIKSCSGQQNFKDNKKFFDVCNSYLVKIVVAETVEEKEFLEAVKIAEKADCVVIQPMRAGKGLAIKPEKLLTLQEKALNIRSDVRIITPAQQFLL